MSVTFEQFRAAWIEDIEVGNPSTIDKGRRFAQKLIQDWTDVNDTTDDIIYCDGAGDGGIDVALLRRGETDQSGESDGDTWYLIQTKYGTAFRGTDTLLIEGQKVIDTLDERRTNLSCLSADLLDRVTQFRRSAATERDRLVLVYGTEAALTESQQRTLNDVRVMGRERIGQLFDVESVSVEAIFQRLQEKENAGVIVSIKGNLADSGEGLMVGAVSLMDLYDFLKSYRSKTEDLDRLYEKNVRRFLGGGRKVNKAIRSTLETHPEHFGLYNNGITIVVRDFKRLNNHIELTEPFVVNGCQTTRSLWEVLHRKLEAGGSGSDRQLTEWRLKAAQGVVVTKVVRVGSHEGQLLQNVTRYTNSQNPVREQDFHALNENFTDWSALLSSRYGVFLEVQRGGWESYRARVQQNPQEPALTRHATALELLKVYGAGWLRVPGTAFGSNTDFAPNGAVFKRTIEHGEGEEAFGANDLYAAYLIQQATIDMEFGRGSQHSTRRQTKFLFCYIIVELLRDVLHRATLPMTNQQVTTSMLKLFTNENQEPLQQLLRTGTDVVDEYFTAGSEDSAFDEPAYRESGTDLNRFLKSDRLAHSEHSPHLHSLLAVTRRTLSRVSGGKQSPRDMIADVVR